MVRGSEATLMIAASESDANLYYATGFLAPDPFVFAEIRGRKILLMNVLELDRARDQADVDEVISTQKMAARLRARGVRHYSSTEMIHQLFLDRHVKQVVRLKPPGGKEAIFAIASEPEESRYIEFL